MEKKQEENETFLPQYRGKGSLDRTAFSDKVSVLDVFALFLSHKGELTRDGR